jgi:type II secretory ATPase GspE/PulE/Tfp pilus assembly ATPase PilB-like protein
MLTDYKKTKIDIFIDRLKEYSSEHINEHIITQNKLLDKSFDNVISTLLEYQIPKININKALADAFNTIYLPEHLVNNTILFSEIFNNNDLTNQLRELHSLVFDKDAILKLIQDNKLELNGHTEIVKDSLTICKLIVGIPYFLIYNIHVLGKIKTLLKENNVFFIIINNDLSSKFYKQNISEDHYQNLLINARDLLTSIYNAAIYEHKASDIHFEPSRDKVSVRFRVNGSLIKYTEFDKQTYAQLTRILFLNAKIRYDKEKEIHDAKINYVSTLDGSQHSLRFSSVPTPFGSTIVLRLYTSKGNDVYNLKELGFMPYELNKVENLINQPYGILFVTGPTGSGKSTTLYSILTDLGRDISKKILSIEDPVEVDIPTIQQVEYNPNNDVNFTTAVKAFLRQDPDIIMVGEIRYIDTAKEAVTAAITGHLVLSTLHTNTTLDSILRLRSLGLENWQITAGTVGSIGQRLVRKLCPNCKQKISKEDFIHKYSTTNIKLLNIPLIKNIDYVFIPSNKGCSYCHNTGYDGRTIVSEVLELNDELKDAIDKNKSLIELRHIAINTGFRSMIATGIEVMSKGITSINELFRVFGSQLYTVDY